MQKWAKCYNFARFASFLPAYNLCPSWEQVRINFCSNWAEVGLGTSAQFGRRCISFYSQLGNNFAHVLYALQIGKQCKPVQVHLFTKIPPEEKFSQIACWGSIPNPLWTPPAVSAAHSFWILLLTDFCAICIEVQFSINEKMKTWEKLSLIIYMICGNPLPNKLSGSLVGNSPTSNESGNARIPLHPKLGWKTSCQLDTKLKMQETETKITST